LLRYAVVVPSYPHLPSLTASAAAGRSPAVSQAAQTASAQARLTGGVHVVPSTEAGDIVTQTASTDVITVCPPVRQMTRAEPTISSRSSVHGWLDLRCNL